MERRTAVILATDAFGGRGGIAQYNRDLAAALAGAPEIGDVAILPRLSKRHVDATPDGVVQHPARLGRLGYILAAWRLCARLRPGIIVCGHLFMAPLAAVLAWLYGARLIVQTHGIEAWTRPPPLQRVAAERADLILAVSRDTRARVLSWARIEPERVRVANNTFAEDFAPGATTRARFGLGDEFVFLTVGRLDARERYKGHDRLIRLLKRFDFLGRTPLYLIAGDGDDRRRLEVLARRCGVAHQVRFLGHTAREDLPDLYRSAELFVLPSTGEGFGIVLLEAMACGVPATALGVGGTADALADGDLGRTLDEGRLFADLEQTCKDRLAGRLESGEALSRRVRARFGRGAFERRIQLGVAELEAA